MNWNEYRQYHKQQFGTTTLKQLSQDYATQKTKNTRSPRRSPKPINITAAITSTPKTRKARIASAKRLKSGEGRGSPTRGWAISSPQRGRERHEMMNKCGENAFLGKNESFPVMNKKCEYVCQGVQSALNRACQYNHFDVARKAQTLGEKECGWSRKTPCKKIRAPQ